MSKSTAAEVTATEAASLTAEDYAAIVGKVASEFDRSRADLSLGRTLHREVSRTERRSGARVNLATLGERIAEAVPFTTVPTSKSALSKRISAYGYAVTVAASPRDITPGDYAVILKGMERQSGMMRGLVKLYAETNDMLGFVTALNAARVEGLSTIRAAADEAAGEPRDITASEDSAPVATVATPEDYVTASARIAADIAGLIASIPAGDTREWETAAAAVLSAARDLGATVAKVQKGAHVAVRAA